MEIESTVRVGVGGTAATNPQEEEDYGGNSQYAHIDIYHHCTVPAASTNAFSDRRDACMALLNLHLHCIDPISSRLHFLHRLLMLVYFYTLLLTAY